MWLYQGIYYPCIRTYLVLVGERAYRAPYILLGEFSVVSIRKSFLKKIHRYMICCCLQSSIPFILCTDGDTEHHTLLTDGIRLGHGVGCALHSLRGLAQAADRRAHQLLSKNKNCLMLQRRLSLWAEMKKAKEGSDRAQKIGCVLGGHMCNQLRPRLALGLNVPYRVVLYGPTRLSRPFVYYHDVGRSTMIYGKIVGRVNNRCRIQGTRT